MSVVPQHRIKRGPAKIIPFPASRSAQVKQPGKAPWIYWMILYLLASIGGEIWSSKVSASAVQLPTAKHKTSKVAGGSAPAVRHAGL